MVTLIWGGLGKARSLSYGNLSWPQLVSQGCNGPESNADVVSIGVI